MPSLRRSPRRTEGDCDRAIVEWNAKLTLAAIAGNMSMTSQIRRKERTMTDKRYLVRQYKRYIRRCYSEGWLTTEQLERLHAIGFYPDIASSESLVTVCYETGEEYPSASAAGRAVGLTYNSINRAINAGYSAGGYHWYRKSDGKPAPGFFKTDKAKKVRCTETGKVFESITAVAKVYKTTQSGIVRAIKENNAVYGVHFAYAADEIDAGLVKGRRRRKYRKLRPIVSLETGEQFDSVSAAAKATGFSPGSFYCALNNERRTVGGCHWKYVDTDEMITNDARVGDEKKQPSRCHLEL